MKVGLVGFAGSGKTTVFNTLTSLHVPTGFGGEVHLGTWEADGRRSRLPLRSPISGRSSYKPDGESETASRRCGEREKVSL